MRVVSSAWAFDHIGQISRVRTWEDCDRVQEIVLRGRGAGMSKDVQMGGAGSLTVALLIVAVTFLLRSFYKRYTRIQKREDDESQ